MNGVDGSDSLQRFVFERARVRGELVSLEATWQEAHRKQEYPDPVRDALGELTAASVLLAATIKVDDGALILQIQGGRPLGLLVVECQGNLTFRATARWDGESEVPEIPLPALARGARCAITLDPGGNRSAYQGIVPLEGATAAESLERYMARSEQLETLFALAADGSQASGILLQKLSKEGGRQPARVDPDLWNRTAHLVRTLTRDELLGLPGREILRRLFHDEELRLFETVPVRFACRCSRDRVAGVIRMIGADEARSVLDEKGRLDVSCEFCGESYVFDRADTERALADAAGGTPSSAG